MSLGRPPGRPRDAALDDMILNAAASLLVADGYERMSVEDVARAAGVSRPTVYRRWPSKAELVIAAVAGLITPERHEPTGDLRADLLDIARSLYDKFATHSYLGLLGPALTERDHHPEIYQAYKDRLINPRRDSVRQVLRRGIDVGALPPTSDVEVGIAMFVGAFYSISVAEEWEYVDDFPTRLVDATMQSLGVPYSVTAGN